MLNGHVYRVRSVWCGQDQSVVYDVSRGPDRRADILAQAERAARWVGWAIREGVLSPNDRLLVIGGGLAGCAAALAAKAVGIDVDLVDREDAEHPLGPLPAAARKIHPTLYRWPEADWRRGSTTEVPPDVRGEPRISAAMEHLGWRGGVGREVFASLAGQCVHELGDRWFRAELAHPRAVSGPRVALGHADGPATVEDVPALAGRRYRRVLVCTGPGPEGVGFPRPPDPAAHHGYPFWDPADRLVRRLGGEVDGVDPFAAAAGEMVIVGSGDGGRQDLVQALSGLHLLDLAERLDDDDDGWFTDVTAAALGRVGTLERTDAVEAEAALEPLARKYGPELLRRVRDLGGAPDERLRRTALYAPDGGTECFHLNRFLTLALHHAAGALLPPHELLRFGGKLEGLMPTDPHANAHACWGEHHHARFTGREGAARFLVMRMGLPLEWFWDRPEWYAVEQDRRAG